MLKVRVIVFSLVLAACLPSFADQATCEAELEARCPGRLTLVQQRFCFVQLLKNTPADLKECLGKIKERLDFNGPLGAYDLRFGDRRPADTSSPDVAQMAKLLEKYPSVEPGRHGEAIAALGKHFELAQNGKAPQASVSPPVADEFEPSNVVKTWSRLKIIIVIGAALGALLYFLEKKMNRKGMSILSIVVALGIASMLAFFVGSFLTNNFKSQLRMEHEMDVNQLGIYVLRKINCSATFPTQLSACLADDGLAVASNDPSNPVLVKPVAWKSSHPKQDYTNVGRLSLRARCVADASGTSTHNKKLVIEYATIDGSGNFSKDAVSKQDQSWRDLFEGLPTPCIVM